MNASIDLNVREFLRANVRTIDDWPVPGVRFRDITPLLQSPLVFRVMIDAFVCRYLATGMRPDVVAGLDARGFIVGSVIAYELGVGFIPIRKKGKLPFNTIEEDFELEYGNASLELHTDAFTPGQRVLLVDDLVATGGTMQAGSRLIERLGGVVMEGAVIINLPALGGAQKLQQNGLTLSSLLEFDGI